MARHIALLGDSIFDNAAYVRPEPAVVEQLQSAVPEGDKVTLLAVDGDTTLMVGDQLSGLPSDVTDLVISVGGNDALQHAHLLTQAKSADDVPALLEGVLSGFQANYMSMLSEVLQRSKPTVVCTIYDCCPFPEPWFRELVPVALEPFNDIIAQAARDHDCGLLELRDICNEDADYSTVSPIEPSTQGGAKIAQAIVDKLL